MKTSPLAPKGFIEPKPINGLQIHAYKAGIKYQDRYDLVSFCVKGPAHIAGVFTQSSTRSAAVLHSQNNIGNVHENGLAILVNSGNSNAFTGVKGEEAMNASLKALAAVTDLGPEAVFMASTGVIGEALNAEPICEALKKPSQSGEFIDAANAIMTTDTFPKLVEKHFTIGDKNYRIVGIAKGSGMIAPDMATMLAFMFTDCPIEKIDLQSALSKNVRHTFNAISVDSDTSTSDSVYLISVGDGKIDQGELAIFENALAEAMLDLAHQIIKDGEGASKFVEIKISGAQSDLEAKKAAMAIANSPLVKTAVAGEDPNWGRIVAALGKSGVKIDRDAIGIIIGDEVAAINGEPNLDYVEANAADHMKNQYVRFRVSIGGGAGQFTAWTTDLTHAYIDINADYRS